MTWKHFIDLLKKQGYDGDGEDFNEVQAWLKTRGLDVNRVKAKGKFHDLQKMYDDRPGRALDVSDAYEEAEKDAEMDRRVQARIKELENAGLVPKNGLTKVHTHDISVRERIEDDECLGYLPFAEGGGGQWLMDIFRDHQCVKEGRIGDRPERLMKATKIMGGQMEKSFGSKQAGMNEAIDSEGGFLAPTEHRRELLRRVYDTGRVFTRARNLPMMSKTIDVPYIVESSRADGSRHGGVQGYWGAEAATMTVSKPALGNLTLTAHKLHALSHTTVELEEDAQAIGALQLLAELFAEELAFKMDDAFVNGDGVGKPLGIMNANCLVTVTRDTTDRVMGNDILNMWSRMWGPSRANAVWFINQDVETDLNALTIENPASSGIGGLIYIPQSSTGAGNISNAPFNTLYGRPVIALEQCATLATTGDVILADMTQYLHGMRRGITTAQSIHVNFVSDQIAFKATLRADGQPWWQAALTPFSGSGNTLSPFVVLSTDT